MLFTCVWPTNDSPPPLQESMAHVGKKGSPVLEDSLTPKSDQPSSSQPVFTNLTSGRTCRNTSKTLQQKQLKSHSASSLQANHGQVTGPTCKTNIHSFQLKNQCSQVYLKQKACLGSGCPKGDTNILSLSVKQVKRFRQAHIPSH